MVRSTGKNLGRQPPDWSEAEAWETEWIEESVAGGGDDLRGDFFCNGVRVSGVLVSRDVFVSHEF